MAEKKEKLVGRIAHFFNNLQVAVVEVNGKLQVGDKIHIKGSSTDFEQKVDSMQVEHESVETAKKGQAVGMKVKEKVREGDEIYKVE